MKRRRVRIDTGLDVQEIEVDEAGRPHFQELHLADSAGERMLEFCRDVAPHFCAPEDPPHWRLLAARLEWFARKALAASSITEALGYAWHAGRYFERLAVAHAEEAARSHQKRVAKLPRGARPGSLRFFIEARLQEDPATSNPSLIAAARAEGTWCLANPQDLPRKVRQYSRTWRKRNGDQS